MKAFNWLAGVVFSIGAVVLGLGGAFYLSLHEWFFGAMLLVVCALAAKAAFVSLRHAINRL